MKFSFVKKKVQIEREQLMNKTIPGPCNSFEVNQIVNPEAGCNVNIDRKYREYLKHRILSLSMKERCKHFYLMLRAQ